MSPHTYPIHPPRLFRLGGREAGEEEESERHGEGERLTQYHFPSTNLSPLPSPILVKPNASFSGGTEQREVPTAAS